MESVDNPPLFRGRVRDLVSIMAWIVAAIHWQPPWQPRGLPQARTEAATNIDSQEQQPLLRILRCTDRLMILLISSDEGQPQYWEQYVLFDPKKWHFWFYLLIHARSGCTASEGPCIMFPERCQFFDQDLYLRLSILESNLNFLPGSCDEIKSILVHYVDCTVRSVCLLCREVDEDMARVFDLTRKLGLLDLGSG